MSVAAIVVVALLASIVICLVVLTRRVAKAQGVLSSLQGLFAAIGRDQSRARQSVEMLAEHFTEAPVTLGHAVTVHTKRPDDQSIHGLLIHEYRDRIELVDAHLVADPNKTLIPGVVRIASRNIAFRQDHPRAADASDS